MKTLELTKALNAALANLKPLQERVQKAEERLRLVNSEQSELEQALEDACARLMGSYAKYDPAENAEREDLAQAIEDVKKKITNAPTRQRANSDLGAAKKALEDAQRIAADAEVALRHYLAALPAVSKAASNAAEPA